MCEYKKSRNKPCTAFLIWVFSSWNLSSEVNCWVVLNEIFWARSQWRSEAKCRPGQTIKGAALSTPQMWQEFKMKEDHVSCSFKDIRITKGSWKWQSNTHRLKWFLFLLSIMILAFFCWSPPSSLLLGLFFLFLMCVYGPSVFRQMFFHVTF